MRSVRWNFGGKVAGWNPVAVLALAVLNEHLELF
jgi:hypothetical protein